MSWGNVLFEESLIYAGLDKDYWKEALKEAIEKFMLGINNCIIGRGKKKLFVFNHFDPVLSLV